MQFNQPDSVIPDPYNTLDWNRYAYARYNPLVYTDPTGHDPVLGFIGGFLKELARTNFWWHPGYQRDLAIKNNESTAELAGRLVADVVSMAVGVAEAGGGTGIAGGGVLACATGVGCPGGAVAIAGGGVLIYQGAGTALNAGNSAGTIIAMLSRGSGNSSLRNFANDDELQDHFKKHEADFNYFYKDKNEYLAGARDFFARKGLWKVDRKRDGATLFYDKNTQEFGVLDKNGNITTYYPLDDGLDGWFELVHDAKTR